MNQEEVIIKKENIDSWMESMPKQGPFGETFLSNSESTTIVNKNVTTHEKADKSELHEEYADLYIILDGEETLFIGGDMINKEEGKPGEWRGSSLKDPREYQVKKGDIVIIPKNVPHQHGMGTIRLIVIKIKQ
ncbi:YhcH/YjgK/YiaL family protein [Patescibacteria group bacterium]